MHTEKTKNTINSSALVSIIIPSHNYGHYLSDTIESALNQTYSKTEIIIIDDDSTDNTLQVAAKHPVSYVFTKHKGAKTPAHAHNVGIKRSKGDFIIFLGADDSISKDYVQECVDRFYEASVNHKVGFVWTGCKEFGDSNRIRVPRKAIIKGAIDGYISPNGQLGAMLVPKPVYNKVGGYDISLTGLEDWDWVIRCLLHGYVGASVQKPLHFARVHDNRVTNLVDQCKTINQIHSRYPTMVPLDLVLSQYRKVNRIVHNPWRLKKALSNNLSKNRQI